MKEIIEKYKKEYKGAHGNYQMNCLLNDAQSGLMQIIEHIENGDYADKYLDALKRYELLIDFGIENTDCMKVIEAMEKQPELTKENSPQGILSRISNRLHNMGCENQNSELGEELGGMACEMWEVLPMISNEEKEEKQPTKYEYVKVTDSIFTLGESFNKGELFTKKFNQEWHQIKSEIQLGGLLSMNDDPEKNGIYRRIPLTAEQLHERKVEELAKFMRSGNPRKGNTDWDGVADTVKEEYLRKAKLALEWMESKE